MSTVVMNKKDEIIMKLVHYFVTEKNYTPIVVRGVKDEIWLENDNADYRIIRINSNYIHNKEQYNFDIYKTKNIMKQIKKKTLSLKMNVLNIFLDMNDDVKVSSIKNIESIAIKDEEEIKKQDIITKVFPDISKKLIEDVSGIDLIVNVTNDINQKTETENKNYEKVFKPKKTIITYSLIAINILVFLAMYIFGSGSEDNMTLYNFGAMYAPAIKNGEIFRLLTSAFLHIGIIHLFCNMYALYILGTQMETFLGKWKFLVIYLVSAITGNLLSMVFSSGLAAGASGAIFGLLGSMLYFGYHYRLYLGEAIKSQIIPVIVLNLFLGFVISGIDNAAHIGGLIGGLLITIALGLENKTSKTERINGIIVFTIFTIFLIYMAFFK